MLNEHDYLQLEDGERGHVLTRLKAPDWPPPEKIWLVRIVQTEDVVGAFPDENLSEALTQIVDFFEEIPIELTPFERVSFSTLPDDMDFSHVARGGLYHPAD